MIRKHFRLKRLVLGLAFAAFAVPVAQAKPVSSETLAQSRGPIASEMSVQSTLTPTQVEGLRWQAMADLYARQAPVRSENSFGAPGPGAAGATGPIGAELVRTSSTSGFDWNDAGIGASITFGGVLALLMAVALGRRYRSRLDRTLASA